MGSTKDTAAGLPPAVLDEIRAFREARDRRLRSEDGWLSLVARHVLLPGGSTFPVPGGDAVVTFIDGDVTIALPDGRTHRFAKGEPGPGPYLMVGTQRFEILRQGDKVAIRVRDPQSPARGAFTGLSFWDPDARFRVTARLIGEPKVIRSITGLGAEVEERSPGTLEMELCGQRATLDPIIEDDSPNKMFILFKDPTNKSESYGAGRFLYTKLADENGQVVLDFNLCFNPPCALTEHASCPVTPPQNHLKVPIEAGEKRYTGH